MTLSLNIENQKKDHPFYIYSKEVKGNKINKNEIERKIEKDKFLNVIDSLLSIGRTKDLDELELKENCKEWITSTLSDFPKIKDEHIKFLIRDFTDSMHTRMREDEKYVLGIVMDGSLILCHSYLGEKTITPSLQVIERMLDKDNVMRYVYFKKEKNDKVLVTFYEETKSVFFAEWLGLPESEAFAYLGGKNRIFTELYGNLLVFEFTDEELEKKIIEDKIFKIEGNQIILPEPIQRLPISQARVGKKPYKNIADFIQDFLAKRYNLKYYQEEYKNLRDSLVPFIQKVIDDEYGVRTKSGIIIKKRNPNFLILFCDGVIEIRESFLEKIKTKMLNREAIRIFHAGMEMNLFPIKIRNVEIYNDIKADLPKFLIDYYNNSSIKDNFDRVFLYTIFELLARINSDKPISYFFTRIRDSLRSEIDFSPNFLKNEDSVLELKSREIISRGNKEIIKTLKKDIEKKLKKSNFVVYVLGADEKAKKIEPISSSRFDDTRVQDLERQLQKQLGNIAKINLLKIPSLDGKECILVLCIWRKEYEE